MVESAIVNHCGMFDATRFVNPVFDGKVWTEGAKHLEELDAKLAKLAACGLDIAKLNALQS